MPADRPLPESVVERMRAAVDAAHASQASAAPGADPIMLPIRGKRTAVTAGDLVLHQASEEPGSLWTVAAKRTPDPTGELPPPNEHKANGHVSRFSRFRVGFPLLRLWR